MVSWGSTSQSDPTVPRVGLVSRSPSHFPADSQSTEQPLILTELCNTDRCALPSSQLGEETEARESEKLDKSCSASHQPFGRAQDCPDSKAWTSRQPSGLGLSPGAQDSPRLWSFSVTIWWMNWNTLHPLQGRGFPRDQKILSCGGPGWVGRGLPPAIMICWSP